MPHCPCPGSDTNRSYRWHARQLPPLHTDPYPISLAQKSTGACPAEGQGTGLGRKATHQLLCAPHRTPSAPAHFPGHQARHETGGSPSVP